MSEEEWIRKFKSEFREQESDLAGEFFEKETTNAVDFEIVLAALLATLCFQYPVTGLAIPISQLSAFSLLIVILSRRIVVSSPYATEDLLDKTVIVIEIATTSCLLSIFASFAHMVNWPLSTSMTFILLSLPSMMALVVIHEFVFRDDMIWWHVKFLQKWEESEHFSDIWFIISIISLWSSKYYYQLPDIDRHRNKLPSREALKDHFDLSFKSYAKLVIRISLLLGILYSFPMILSYVIFGIIGLAIIPAIVAIHDMSCFWYIGYGDTSYEDLRRHFLLIIFLTSLYALELGYLLKLYSLFSILKIVQELLPLFALLAS